MEMGNKRIIVVGDRVLIKQEDMEKRTSVGLYLPQTVVDKEDVQGGRIVEIGPGIPIPEVRDEDEPWKATENEPRYLPLQAEIGDYALFMKKASMEVKFENENYIIVPHSSILILVRPEPDIMGQIEGLDL